MKTLKQNPGEHRCNLNAVKIYCEKQNKIKILLNWLIQSSGLLGSPLDSTEPKKYTRGQTENKGKNSNSLVADQANLAI